MIGWMFPGQGSQRAGMANGIQACKELFEVGRSKLGTDLEKLCTSDSNPTWPPDLLQPALYTTCVGVGRTMLANGLEPQALIGHSLGEFAALATAGSVTFEDGLRLVAIRGKAMAAAGRSKPGGMAAVIGLDAGTIDEICREAGEVWVANLNSPTQTVISGKDGPLAQAAERCRHAGASRVVRLDVPIAGHCPLMESAAEQVEAELSTISVGNPRWPIYFGADGRPHTDPQEIKTLLVEAITSRVRFVEAVLNMRQDGVKLFVETGPGRVLRGLLRQIIPDAQLAGVAGDDQTGELAESLKAHSNQRPARSAGRVKPTMARASGSPMKVS
jgi:[acyl-carrier-protein] S-malonyltransferase